ncbi:MAG: hypothetical protein DI538_05445 [Azospira oryzae]|jgi:hypothetical protein|nr:MAG: hypothetical protein DI538_05445 [Azospira oryzae]
MNIRSSLVSAFVVLSTFLFAQQGNYFLNHYTPSDERIDYVTFGITQDQKGVLYFANRSGVLEFDGRNWSLIATPGPVYSVTTQGDNVFAGGYGGFGKLVWGTDNTRTYQSLSDGLASKGQIFSSLADKEQVYFLSEQFLYVYSTGKDKTEIIKTDAVQGSFTGLFEVGGNFYVHTELKGLLKINAGKLVPLDFNLPAGQSVMFCSSLQGKTKTLIGAESGALFLFDGGAAKELVIKDKAFLENNILVTGTWIGETLIALGTLRGGVIFVNPVTGVTEEITNYYSGLPDNEVYSLFSDRNQGVWIAHDYGFTRVAPYLPFRSYSHYPGLAGNLLCALNYKDQIYVGTTIGLFGLVREEIYEEIISSSVVPRSKKGTVQEQSKNKKGMFSFLRRNKKQKEIEPEPVVAKETKDKGKKSTARKTAANVSKPAKTTRPVLKTIRYAFKKVDGIDGKVSQLIDAYGKLLAAGISGVAEVEGLKSKSITHEPVRSIFVSSTLDQLLASTLNEEIKTFSPKGSGWNETHLLDTLQDYVSYIFEDRLHNIWLCSRTNVYKVETVDNQISGIESIPFSNPAVDETTGLAYGSDVYVAASGTIKRFNIKTNQFEKYDSIAGPKKYFASAGYFWFNDGHHWRTVDPRMQSALKLEWLGLFRNIRFLAPVGKDQGLWIITASNELYRFSSNTAAEQASYPLFLREIRGQQSKITPSQSVKVSQLESTVTFEFIQPDYLGMGAVEYRYMVRGLNKSWSAWSTTNNVVNFSYLPTGKYKVEVQTRDIMDKVSSIKPILMEVEPPYWKRSWFYAAELIFFGALVFLSLRLSSVNSKYRYISSLLSLLTVIMLIQFIQTILASQISFKSTPVIEFFIQVTIALLVLPIEGYLRKVMVRTELVENNTSVVESNH